MKCEVCEKDILVRSYTYHMWYKHQEKKTKEDESAAVADVEGNKSSIRGSRAAAQKYVERQIHTHTRIWQNYCVNDMSAGRKTEGGNLTRCWF